MFVRKSTCDAVIRGRDYYRGLSTERQDRILELAREGDRLQADLESATSGKDWWRDNAEGCGERLSQVTAERNRLQAELDKMTGDRNFYRNWKEAIERDFREQKARIADLEAELRQLFAEVDTLKADLAWEKEGYKQLGECYAQSREKCDKLEQITRQARGEYSEAKGMIRKLQAELDTLKAEPVDDYEHTRLHNEIARLQAELASRSRVMHCPCGFSTFR